MDVEKSLLCHNFLFKFNYLLLTCIELDDEIVDSLHVRLDANQATHLLNVFLLFLVLVDEASHILIFPSDDFLKCLVTIITWLSLLLDQVPDVVIWRYGEVVTDP